MIDEEENIVICQYSGKRCYTEREAGNVMRNAKKGKVRKHKVPKRKYFCDACGFYHLTSQAFNRYQGDWKDAKRKKRYIKNNYHY